MDPPALYRKTINYTLPPDPPAPVEPPVETSGLSSQEKAAVIAVPTVLVPILVLVALAMAVAHQVGFWMKHACGLSCACTSHTCCLSPA